MWALENHTPYAAERTWIRDKTGTHSWVLAVRATYTFDANGKIRLADEQLPPARCAEHFGEPGASSIKYEADLGPLKPATDVTFLASAHAERGRPSASVLVGFRLGKLRKALMVHGDRMYVRAPVGLALSKARPFVKKAIRYESAFGGSDTTHADPNKHMRDAKNPIGRGFAIDTRRLVDQLAHDIEYPNVDPVKSGPAGLSPIASHWLPRLQYAGTYDDQWSRTKKPLLPDDYDERFTLCAPMDQRCDGYLQGGELLELTGMTPGGTLRLKLPTVELAFETRFGSKRKQHPGHLTSVIVEPDEERLSLVWQTSLLVRSRDATYLDATAVTERT